MSSIHELKTEQGKLAIEMHTRLADIEFTRAAWQLLHHNLNGTPSAAPDQKRLIEKQIAMVRPALDQEEAEHATYHAQCMTRLAAIDDELSKPVEEKKKK